MQLVVVAVAIAAISGSSAFAEEGKEKKDRTEHGRAHDAQAMLARMTEQLNLTADQQAKLKPLFEDLQKQMQALQADEKMTPEARRAKAGEIRKAHTEKVDAILTPEQKAKREEMRKNAAKPKAAPEGKKEHAENKGK
jgi:Spy/CpxP family protein refolding chaperone